MNPFNNASVNFFGNKTQSKIILDEAGNERKVSKGNFKKSLSLVLLFAALCTMATLSFAGSSEPRLAGGNGGATGRPNGK